MTDRIEKLREKAELLEIDDPGVVQDLVDVALTYTDEDVERVARELDRQVTRRPWEMVTFDQKAVLRRYAVAALESFGARRAE